MKKLSDMKQFWNEKMKVQKLRKEGLSFNKIAKEMGKSTGWVMQRHYDSYRPKTIDRKKFFEIDTLVRDGKECKTEEEFIMYGIMPKMDDLGFECITDKEHFSYVDWKKYDKFTDLRPEVDLVYVKEKTTYIIEVKKKLSVTDIYKSIGQIMTLQYVYSKHKNIKYWIVFPEEVKTYKYFEKNFMEWLKNKMNIEIHFF